MVVLLFLTNNILLFLDPAVAVYPNLTAFAYWEYCSIIQHNFHNFKNRWNLVIAICVNIDIHFPLCTCDKIIFIIHNCSPVPAWWVLVFSSARLKLSPVRPKLFDTTACSYLTWAPALCVCTINTMPHELYSWEWGGRAGESGDCSLEGGADTQKYFPAQKHTQMVYAISVNFTFERLFVREVTIHSITPFLNQVCRSLKKLLRYTLAPYVWILS